MEKYTFRVTYSNFEWYDEYCKESEIVSFAEKIAKENDLFVISIVRFKSGKPF